MPNIDFSGSTLEDFDTILARMIYPKSEVKRQNYYKIRSILRQIQSKNENDTIQILKGYGLTLPKLINKLKSIKKYDNYGATSGLVLIYMYILHKNNKPSSFNLGCYLTEKSIEKQITQGNVIKPSPSQIRKKWSEYKTVAHLWAGLVFAEMCPEAKEFFSKYKIHAIISFSNIFLDFGTSFTPPKAKTTVLTLDECWISNSELYNSKLTIKLPKLSGVAPISTGHLSQPRR